MYLLNFFFTQEFPVKELIPTELIGSNIRNVHGVKDALVLIWNQTWPLFTKPHTKNMLMLCSVSFLLYSVSFGLNMWFPQIIAIYHKILDASFTTCQAIQTGYTLGTNQSIGNGYTYYSIIVNNIGTTF